MGVIAEFKIGSAQFPLGSLLDATPEMSVELDRIVPASGPGVPYVWATGGDFDEFERIVAEGSLIESLHTVDRIDDSVLYRIEWAPDTESLLQEIARSGVNVLEAYRGGDDWTFRLRFDEHDDLVRFHRYCRDRDVEYRLTRVYSEGERPAQSTAFGLTREQFDALALAVDRGYFEVPRRVTLRELGAEIGITQQAVSERVRRGANNVLRTVLLGSAVENVTP